MIKQARLADLVRRDYRRKCYHMTGGVNAGPRRTTNLICVAAAIATLGYMAAHVDGAGRGTAVWSSY
jgi:hypothetical protein